MHKIITSNPNALIFGRLVSWKYVYKYMLSHFTILGLFMKIMLFFLHTFPLTIAFKLEYALFYQFYAKITVFFIKKCSV